MGYELDYFTTKTVDTSGTQYSFDVVNAAQLLSDVSALNAIKTTQNNTINDISNNLDNLISTLVSYAQSTQPSLAQLASNLNGL